MADDHTSPGDLVGYSNLLGQGLQLRLLADLIGSRNDKFPFRRMRQRLRKSFDQEVDSLLGMQPSHGNGDALATEFGPLLQEFVLCFVQVQVWAEYSVVQHFFAHLIAGERLSRQYPLLLARKENGIGMTKHWL